MSIFVHIIIIFIYIIALVTVSITNLDDKIFINKLYIFLGIFLFEFIVSIILAIHKKCVIDVGHIAQESLITALLAITAYSIFNDLMWYDYGAITSQAFYVQKLILMIMIIAFISVGYLFRFLFGNMSPCINDCLNYVYKKS